MLGEQARPIAGLAQSSRQYDSGVRRGRSQVHAVSTSSCSHITADCDAGPGDRRVRVPIIPKNFKRAYVHNYLHRYEVWLAMSRFRSDRTAVCS